MNAKYISMENVKKFPMMLTKACIDPHNLKIIPLYQVEKNEVDEEFWVNSQTMEE